VPRNVERKGICQKYLNAKIAQVKKVKKSSGNYSI
jgi:hypothetical protein